MSGQKYIKKVKCQIFRDGWSKSFCFRDDERVQNEFDKNPLMPHPRHLPKHARPDQREYM
jgi:hypothetical protein